jgi:hypothetical protein
MKMESDLNRFRKIVRGKIKKELRRFISSGDLIGRQGKKQVTIPLPRIDLPRFQFGDKNQGGVGQGQGEVGDSVGQGEGQESGEGKAGDQAGQHNLEVDVTLEELAEILGEELRLPNIENKGKKNIDDLDVSKPACGCEVPGRDAEAGRRAALVALGLLGMLGARRSRRRAA